MASTSLDDELILPDSYWGGDEGTIPIFKPTMDQFRSFPEFIKKIDRYGMKTGIVKVIPPQEWLDALPELDDKVKDIRVQSAIEQNFAGSGGAFRQMNLEKHRTYSLPQWRKICDSSEHQPPAKRGEARGVGGRKQKPKKAIEHPPTPPATTDSDSGSPEPQQDPKSRRKQIGKSRDATERTEYDDFDYRIDDNEQYTPERCSELERSYWKSLTFNNPMYGADLPGSLFDDDTKEWNVANLDNILNRLGVVLPGVNSAYLYLGMWKATFSWHVEDMDLYSINYIHFGAPKQWYSVAQEDNQKFEKIMKDIFPNDARHCGQFMRHKTFGASPARLAQHGLEVNKLVHYEKEFVITFPYGYHSGYNLGYNCAESVNFATEEWLEYGKVAKKCECVTDAVSIDVDDIIRAVNGHAPVSEFDEEEMLTPPASEDGLEEQLLASPERPTYSEFDRLRRTNTKKRHRDLIYESGPTVQYKKLSDKYHGKSTASQSACQTNTQPTKPVIKKIKLTMPRLPCDLCGRAPRYEDVLDAGAGKKVHRVCAEYIPETSVVKEDGATAKEKVVGFDAIDKARMALKCSHCRIASGACFQCSSPKCVRAFHGSCAYDAGVLVQKIQPEGANLDEKEVPYHFLCKTHRPRRPPTDHLEFDTNITQYASSLQVGQPVQAQFVASHAFAGIVRENRKPERSILIEVGNEGDMIEVDYQWILATPRKVVPSAKQASVVARQSTTTPIVPVPAQEEMVLAEEPRKPSVHPYSVAQGFFKSSARPSLSQQQQSSLDGHSYTILPSVSPQMPQTVKPSDLAKPLDTTEGAHVYTFSQLPTPPHHSVTQMRPDVKIAYIQPGYMQQEQQHYPSAQVPQYFKIGSNVPTTTALPCVQLDSPPL